MPSYQVLSVYVPVFPALLFYTIPVHLACLSGRFLNSYTRLSLQEQGLGSGIYRQGEKQRIYCTGFDPVDWEIEVIDFFTRFCYIAQSYN